jgi:hypothetical protein
MNQEANSHRGYVTVAVQWLRSFAANLPIQFSYDLEERATLPKSTAQLTGLGELMRVRNSHRGTSMLVSAARIARNEEVHVIR